METKQRSYFSYDLGIYMGICINIDKYKVIDGVYIYRVVTADGGGYDFFVGLSQNERTISFYRGLDSSNPFRIIYVDNPCETIGVDGISPMISAPVISKCIKAINLNHFPESMGYYA